MAAGALTNYREFTAALICTIFLLLVLIFMGLGGWEGDPDNCFTADSGCFCENINERNPLRSRVRVNPGVFAQPVNTWSNMGFVVVGLGLMWWTGWERATNRRKEWSNRFTNGTFYKTLFAAIAIFLGPGSMFFHASLREWAGWLDTVSLLLFFGFITAYNVTRYYDLKLGWFVLIFCLLVGITSLLAGIDYENSQIYFYIVAGHAFVSQVLVYWRPSVVTSPWGWWWFAAGASSFLTALVIWVLSYTGGPLCDPDSVAQGHGLFHLLSANTVFCLWQYFRAESPGAVVPTWMWTMARIFFGIIVGLGIGGAFGFVLGDLILETDEEVTWALAAIFGGFGAIYSPIAFVNEVYGHGVLSLLGYVLDLTWSSINTLAGLVVWIPACLIAGGKLKPATGDSKRSGSFVYDKNPRGGGLDTTIGNVVAGGWSAHEEIHIWQARIFGPAYLISYGVSYALNFLFYLWKMKVTGIVMGAYRRVVWEDWAYWGGSSSSNDIHWGPWIGGFFLTLLYMTFFVMIPLGIALEEVWVWVVGIVGLCVYTMIRTFLKA